MSIPELNEDGLLPEGIHEASMDQVRESFGHFQKTDRRPTLYTRFSEFMGQVALNRPEGTAMITIDEQLTQALDQMGGMYRGAGSPFRTEVQPKNRQWFTLMAEGPVDEIRLACRARL